MGFDYKTNTVKLETSNPDEFPIETIIFYTRILGNFAKDPAAKSQIIRDAETLTIWLREDITNLSADAQKKLKTAYLAYLSLGRAPSYSQKALFEQFANKQDAKERVQYKPPTEILSIFDRMLASDAEIKEKRAADHKAHSEKLSQIAAAARIVNSSSQLKAKTETLSKWWNKYILLCVLWVAWVYVRTATEFELLGYYFDEWDKDMFLINALIVPVPLCLFGWWKNKSS